MKSLHSASGPYINIFLLGFKVNTGFRVNMNCKCNPECGGHAQVVALTTAIGVLKGTGSEAFAVGLVFSLVVRRHHPEQLNAVKLDRYLGFE